MHFKVVRLILLLQALAFSKALDTVTIVIDTEADLLAGSSVQESLYVKSPAQLPPGLFPDEIAAYDGAGFWLFSSSRPGNGIIALTFDTTFIAVELRYYSKGNLTCYLKDLAQDEVEVPFPLKQSLANQWSSAKFEMSRKFLSDKPVTFRLVFPESEELGLLLLDSISYTAETTSTTVIDIEEGFPGTVLLAEYIEASDQLPVDIFPELILESGSKGHWLFNSTKGPVGFISLKLGTPFLQIALSYYNTEKILVHVKDPAQGPDEIQVSLPPSNGDDWTHSVFQIERTVVSDKELTFRFEFPKPETPAFFLLDSISYTWQTIELPTTTAEPVITSTTSPDPSSAATTSRDDTTTGSGQKSTTPAEDVETTTVGYSSKSTTEGSGTDKSTPGQTEEPTTTPSDSSKSPTAYPVLSVIGFISISVLLSQF